MLKEGDIVQVIKREDHFWDNKIPHVEEDFFEQKYIIYRIYREDNEYYIKNVNPAKSTRYVFEGRNLKKANTIRKIV